LYSKNIHTKFIKVSLFAFLFIFNTAILLGQQNGDKVQFTAVDGKVYTGTITDTDNSRYKIKYDGFDFESWLANNQFTVVSTNTPTYTSPSQTNNLIGSKVSFLGTDGKTYTGIINDSQGDKYKIKYDGFDFEAWVVREQFTLVSNNTSTTYTPVISQQNNSHPDLGNQPSGLALRRIFDFGKSLGWATQVQENLYSQYITSLSETDKNRLLSFILKAKTSSAQFFVLKSWLCKDPIAMLQKFIDELNAYPESYQQEKCLITSHRSVIQQWQNTCAVTTVEAFLADLCPRYSWDLKQIDHFDVVANDPNNANAQEQKILLEKYGAPAAVRGDNSAKVIPINGALDDFVGPLLGVHFYTQQVNESLPAVFSKIRSQLDKGLDVPLLVGFMGTQARHFLLTLKYRNTGNGYEYLIYDPWDGVCDYVKESGILQNSFSPLLSAFKISVDYYYPTN